jgi:predicted nucleic acid-binding protein
VFANRYTVFIDACSLADVLRRDILLTLAEGEFFRLQWSAEVMAETEKALATIFAKKGVADAPSTAATQCERMRVAFPEAMVDEFQNYMPSADGLPDPDDRHVLAAAIKAQASTIVTENMKDFPAAVLAPLGIEAKTADEFIADTIELDIGRAVAAIRRRRTKYRKPDMTADAFLLKMEASGLNATADILRPHIESL